MQLDGVRVDDPVKGLKLEIVLEQNVATNDGTACGESNLAVSCHFVLPDPA